MTNTPIKVFVDTSSFVSLYDEKDPNHNKANKLITLLDSKKAQLYTSSDVIGETLTVISRKLGKNEAAIFFKKYEESGISEIFIDEEIHDETKSFFLNTKSKNISFIDCSSVVAMKKRGLKVIFAFDQDFKKLGVEMFSA